MCCLLVSRLPHEVNESQYTAISQDNPPPLHSFTYLDAYYALGTVLGAYDTTANQRQRSLPSEGLALVILFSKNLGCSALASHTHT